MKLEGRSSPAASTAQKSINFVTVSRRWQPQCAIQYIRPPDWCHAFGVTSPQPPSFRQRIAAAQEGDECLSRLLPNDSLTSAKTRSY
jgi:hypothetical protein